MKSIRNWSAGSAALGAVMALALAPAPVMADESHSSLPRTAPKLTFMAIAMEPSAACLAARQALVTAWTNDRDEDTAERQAAKLAGADPTVDVKEDKSERAALLALWDTARTTCAAQPEAAPKPRTPSTSACLAAKQALKNALAASWKAEAAEKTSGTENTAADLSEDKAELAALKPLWTAVGTACGFPSATKNFSFTDRR
jgi:hypothetical protein